MRISIDSEEDIQRLIDLAPKEMLGIIDNNDPRRIFNLAVEFFEGGLRCLDPWFVDDQLVSLPAPVAIVNIAFCLELFLKSQILSEGKIAKGHNLEKLFDSTSQEYKDTVVNNYFSVISRSREKLLSDIKNFSNAFVDWRYMYEKNSTIRISTHLLVCVAKSVFQASVTLHPDWKTRIEVFNRLSLGSTEEIAQLIVLPQGGRLILTSMAPRDKTPRMVIRNVRRDQEYSISYIKDLTIRL